MKKKIAVFLCVALVLAIAVSGIALASSLTKTHTFSSGYVGGAYGSYTIVGGATSVVRSRSTFPVYTALQAKIRCRYIYNGEEYITDTLTGDSVAAKSVEAWMELPTPTVTYIWTDHIIYHAGEIWEPDVDYYSGAWH